MKDIFEKIAIAAPVDKSAAIVTSKGFEYTPDKKIQTADQSAPIPIKHRPRVLNEDLTGRRVGRFVVVGLALDVKARWVVKCDCGTYTLRSAKAIKNKENIQDRCENCRHLAYLKRDQHYRSYGIDRDIREF